MEMKSSQEIGKDKAISKHVLPARTGFARRYWLWILLLSLIGLGIYAYVMTSGKQQPAAQPKAGTQTGRGGNRNANAARLTPVVTAAARTGNMNVYLNGLGSVTPLNTVTVRTRVDGQLMKIFFKEGQIVKQGDLLAEIDPRPFQVQLTQAEGLLARDQALLKNAKVDLERYRMLFQQDSIAKQQLDTQEALVRQYEGTAKADQGQVDNAKLQLIYARITAPISGRIGLRQVDLGNIVHAADANGLAVITQVQPASVVFTLPEDNIPAIMKKLRAGNTLTADAYDRSQTNKLASGVLLTIDNQIDPTTGTVKLKAQFANEEYSLFPNQFVNTRLLLDVKQGITIIPTAAVQRGSQGSFVYVLKQDQTVAVRPVKLGITQGDDTEILAGVTPGEQLVTQGADKLRDGAKVELAQSRSGARGRESGNAAAGAPAGAKP